MAITVSSITIQGTACPWPLGSSSNNAGSASALVAYNQGFSDGSVADSGTAGQNSSYKYGQQHTHSGETAPTSLSVSAGQIVILQYVSGTVATQSAGAGSSTPAGSATTTLTPQPNSETDANGYTLPTNVIQGYRPGNASGTVNTSGTTVTWVSGNLFNNYMIGDFIWINNVEYTVVAINGTTAGGAITMTIGSSAGTQTGVAYFTYGAKTSVGGLVGAFTDSSGNIISALTNWDFQSLGGFVPNSSATFTSISAAGSGLPNYNGSALNIVNVAGNYVTVTGFSNSQNNGTFYCIAAAASGYTLDNANFTPETHAGAGQNLTGIMLKVPVGATQLLLGINDTVLFDNTGSYSFQAIVMDTTSEWIGSSPTFKHFPASGNVSPAFMPDSFAGLSQSVWMGTFPGFQYPGSPLAVPYVGQIFPRGAQNTGGNPGGVGQNFPY